MRPARFSPCRARASGTTSSLETFSSTCARQRAATRQAYYYPDAMLVCDPDDTHPLYKTAPCFVAEVLSPATAGIDLREKWLHYRDLPGLRYYLVADSEKRHARLFSRHGKTWREETLGEAGVARIECGGVTVDLGLDDLHEDTGLK